MEDVKFVDIHSIMYQNSESEEDSDSEEEVHIKPEVNTKNEDDSEEEFQFPDDDLSGDERPPSPPSPHLDSPSEMSPDEDDIVDKKADPEMYFVGSKFLPNLAKRYAEYDKLFKYRCDQCLDGEDGSIEFANFKEMREHFRKIHKAKTGRAYCCGREILEKSFLGHLRQHLVPNEFKCDECGQQCDNKKMLDDHKSEHSKSSTTIFCEECGDQFDCHTDYQKHVSKVHRSGDHQPGEKQIANYDKLFLYLCEDCLETNGKPKRFADFSEMRKHFSAEGHRTHNGYAFCCGGKVAYKDFTDHVRLHHSTTLATQNLSCPDCDDSFKTKITLELHRFSKHLSSKGKKPLECTICNIKFDLQKDYEEHLNTTHKESVTAPGSENTKSKRACNPNAKRYKCTECKESFGRHQTRNEHMAQHHEKVKIFRCKHCSNSYRSYVYLLRHNCRKAKGQPNDLEDPKLFKYYCNQCEIKFDTTKELANHYRTAVHNPLVVCDLCGKSYKKNNLKQHMNVKHSKGEVICQDCGRTYSSEVCLYQHRRQVHSGKFYPCPSCEYKSRFPQYLYIHTRRKHGINPNGTPFVPGPSQIFDCSVCNKGCRTKLALQEHMAVHTGDRKFQCLYCSASFKTSSNFYKHRKEQHPIEYAEWKKNTAKF